MSKFIIILWEVEVFLIEHFKWQSTFFFKWKYFGWALAIRKDWICLDQQRWSLQKADSERGGLLFREMSLGGGGGRKLTPILFLLVPEKNEQEIFYFYIIGIGRDVNYFWHPYILPLVAGRSPKQRYILIFTFLVPWTQSFIDTHNEEISTCINAYISPFLSLAGEIFVIDIIKADEVGKKKVDYFQTGSLFLDNGGHPV